MLSIFFPHESLFRDAGHSIHSSISLIKIDCSLQIIKHLTALDNNISTESVLEQCIETFHNFSHVNVISQGGGLSSEFLSSR